MRVCVCVGFVCVYAFVGGERNFEMSDVPPAAAQALNADSASTTLPAPSARDLALASVRARRLFVGVPVADLESVTLQAGKAAADLYGEPAPTTTGEAASLLGAVLLKDRSVGEELIATFVELGGGRKRPREDGQTDGQTESLLDAVVAGLGGLEKGKTPYTQLGAFVKVPTDPLTYEFLYPHRWVKPNGPEANAERWYSRAVAYVPMTAFSTESKKLQCQNTLEDIKSWIKRATVEAANGPLSNETFRSGWNRFVDLAELVAIAMKKNTVGFHGKVTDRLNDSSKLFMWDTLFRSLAQFQPFRPRHTPNRI